jgi:hypothetical protein
VIGNEKKSKKIPTISQGVTQGASDSLICSSDAEKAPQEPALRDPLDDGGDFFTFFLISNHLLHTGELLSSFQTFLRKIAIF